VRNKWLLGVGAVLLVLGIVLWASGGGIGAAYLAFIGAILILAGFLVGPRYKAELLSPPEGYEPTGETFVDPTSRHTVEVYRRPQDGHRVYVRKA
jgi:hypothetical protein